MSVILYSGSFPTPHVWSLFYLHQRSFCHLWSLWLPLIQGSFSSPETEYLYDPWSIISLSSFIQVSFTTTWYTISLSPFLWHWNFNFSDSMTFYHHKHWSICHPWWRGPLFPLYRNSLPPLAQKLFAIPDIRTLYCSWLRFVLTPVPESLYYNFERILCYSWSVYWIVHTFQSLLYRMRAL